MVSLGDRLDFIVGAKAAGPLDEVFGIQTVDDLLRHYPRSYVEGTTVRGADDEQPPEGEHVTLVDVITDAALLSDQKSPQGQAVSCHPRLRSRQSHRDVLPSEKVDHRPAVQGHPRHAVRRGGLLP